MIVRFVPKIVVVGLFLFVCQITATEPEDGEYYKIRCIKSMKHLSNNNKKNEGDIVVQASPGPYENQHWKFVKMGDFYKIINRKWNKVLAVAGGSKEKGSSIEMQDDTGTDHQLWSVEKKEDAYVLRARHSLMVIDAEEDNTVRRAKVMQWPFTEGRNQLFELIAIKK
jgi:hypothetical protein